MYSVVFIEDITSRIPYGTPTFIKDLGLGRLSVSGQFHNGLQSFTAKKPVAIQISDSTFVAGMQRVETSGGQPSLSEVGLADQAS